MLQSLSCLRPSSPALPGDLTDIFRSSEYEQDVKYGSLHEDMEQQKLSNTLLNNQPNMPPPPKKNYMGVISMAGGDADLKAFRQSF